MAIQQGQDISANDFVDESAGAADEGKSVKLNASGELDESFLPDQTVANKSPAAVNTQYTNSSGRPQLHMVSVGFVANNGLVTLDGVVSSDTVAEASQQNPTASTMNVVLNVTFFVPTGATFSVTTGITGSSTVGSIVAWKVVTL